MKIQSLRPVCYTRELDETIEFYTIVLKFTLAEYNKDWSWASLFRDEVEIMLAEPNQHTHFERPVFTGSFYFSTNDVNALWLELKEKVRVCYELQEFEWGMREFAFYDNNGYLLQFGQEI